MKKQVLIPLVVGVTLLTVFLIAGTGNNVQVSAKQIRGEVATAPTGVGVTVSKADKSITRIDLNKGNVVFLTGEVNFTTTDVAREIRDHSRANKPTYLLIDSPGGSVTEGMKVITAIQESVTPVYTVCT
jgi:ATP-dependent protease ClpP protease subunit